MRRWKDRNERTNGEVWTREKQTNYGEWWIDGEVLKRFSFLGKSLKILSD